MYAGYGQGGMMPGMMVGGPGQSADQPPPYQQQFYHQQGIFLYVSRK